MIDYSSKDGVATLILRGEAGHIVTEALVDALCTAIGHYALDTAAQVAVLIGEGAVFSAGAALGSIGGVFNSDAGRLATEALDALSKPVVAALRGAVFGAALEIALACDWRIADASVQIGFPEFGIGLPPAAGATQRLPTLVGVAAALELMLDSTPIGAEHARKIGLVDALSGSDWTESVLRFANDVSRTRRPRVESVNTDIPAALAALEQRSADLAALRCAEGVAVCEAVAAGLSQGWDAGYAAELEGYLRCENSTRHLAVRNARQMRDGVETRGVPKLDHELAPLARVIVVGDVPDRFRFLRTLRLIHLDDIESLPDDLGSNDAIVVLGAADTGALEWAASRAASSIVVNMELMRVSVDADARAALPGNIVFGITYGRGTPRVLQIIQRPGTSALARARGVEIARLFGLVCVHGSSVALGPAALLEFEDVVYALLEHGVSPTDLAESIEALGLPPVECRSSWTPNPSGAAPTPSGEPLRDALMCALLNACAGLLDRNDALHPDDLDTLFHYGYDVPPESMPFSWGASVHSVTRVYSDLIVLEGHYGAIFKPGALLTRVGKVEQAA